MPHVEFGLSITKINDDIPLLQIQYKYNWRLLLLLSMRKKFCDHKTRSPTEASNVPHVFG